MQQFAGIVMQRINACGGKHLAPFSKLRASTGLTTIHFIGMSRVAERNAIPDYWCPTQQA
jgi:hypothetical protein